MENIIINGQISRNMNFSMQQNFVPLIRSLTIINRSEEEYRDCNLVITSVPEFTVKSIIPLDALTPGKTLEISPVPVLPDADKLMALNERVMVNLHVAIVREDETVLYERDFSMLFLSITEWSGLHGSPEMIAAFSMPNDPAVSHLLNSALAILNDWGKNPAFTGYQSHNPNTVLTMMAAIYGAIQKENIAYTVPPASFEETGQRIRIAPVVLKEKMGTCLDLSLLYASCLEQAGLHPVLVFQKEHCFCGAWLEETTFSDCAIDDLSALTKRTAEGLEQLAFVECTDLVVGKNVSFDDAKKHALKTMLHEADFNMAVDITRSRNGGIRPLPVTISEDNRFVAVNVGNENRGNGAAPAAINNYEIALNSNVALTKDQLWERKLLDLSLRNTLLSFRNTKSVVQLMTTDLAGIEDGLQSGDEYRILCAPDDWTNTQKDSRVFETETNRDYITTIAANEKKSKRIRTFLSQAELDTNLKYLYRQAKVSLEENGSNTLYLALGFLKWYESDVSEKERYAPIVLVPIDLVKKATDHSYTIRLRDDECVVNITLLELLHQNFGITIGGLDPLPQDENGIDLIRVFQTVRQAVLDQKRWDVKELAYIGLFSFSRFIMWNDLRARNEDLRKNKVVASLMSGAMEWTPEMSLDESSEEKPLDYSLDEELDPETTIVPTSADASQLAAICAAGKGESFVLHGPPGTGKSQTITNMIANALFQGKRVLFVAEKMAALSVVEKRLDKLGIGEFCLELHSNKAQKRAVLAQLNDALEVGKLGSPAEFKAEAEHLLEMRRQLNGLVKTLHMPRTYGMSLYEAITVFEQNPIFKGSVTFPESFLNQCDEETMNTCREALTEFLVARKACPKAAMKALEGVRTEEVFLTTADELDEKLNQYLTNTDALEKNFAAVKSALGLSEANSYNYILSVYHCLKAVAQSQNLCAAGFHSDLFEAQAETVKNLIQNGNRLNMIYAGLLSEYREGAFSYDMAGASNRYAQLQAAGGLKKSFGEAALVKELKAFAKNPATVTKENLATIYARFHEYATLYRAVTELPAELTMNLAPLYNGASTDWNVLEESYQNTLALRELFAKAYLGEEDKKKLFSVYTASISGNPSYQSLLLTVSDYLRVVDSYLAFEDGLEAKERISLLAHNGEEYFEDVKSEIRGIRENLPSLRAWVSYRKEKEHLVNMGLLPALEAMDAGRVDPSDIIVAVETNLAYQYAARTIKEEPALAAFRGERFELTIAEFRKANDEYQALALKELRARLCSKIPASGTANAGSEVGLLKKNIKSNGRSMSIRKLFDSIPELLGRMCPCMLMSPISVAQYIDPSYPKFDLVIFDEASQLPTSEAVGAIARGENVIVVGDPKQLPPTSFFMANQMDEENIEVEDMESVLDDCLALNMPQMYLKWHYRSRHESLIAYSNSKYYEGKLFTYPSPNNLISKVSYVPIEGVYEKRGARQNRAEAEAVVAEIVRRLKDEQLRKYSIGVVTFNVTQQNLVDDLLQEAFDREPELLTYAEAAEDPIIIKNLENVQGDERDVILFSIGYGPDKDGKVSMNFGPLNNAGGWRRLNVAITRSKQEMIVFATLRPEMIDLSRTTAEGVIGLKGFLEFAIRGTSALPERNGRTEKRDNRFEKQLAREIEKMGYETRINIGSSEYKIDIGVVNPENPEEYILGILCDGKVYADAKTARDRNILQPDMLMGLGWHMLHVWSLDYLYEKEKTLETIRKAIEKALHPDPEPTPEEPKIGNLGNGDADGEKENGMNSDGDTEEDSSTNSAMEQFACRSIYEKYPGRKRGNAEDFLSPGFSIYRREEIEEALEIEAPATAVTLAAAVARSFGIEKTTAKHVAVIEEDLKAMALNTTQSAKATFYWRAAQHPEIYEEYRVPGNTGVKREPEDIPVEEWATCILCVMKCMIGCEREALLKEVAREFGFTRMRESLEFAISRGLQEARKRGYIDISSETGKISLR